MAPALPRQATATVAANPWCKFRPLRLPSESHFFILRGAKSRCKRHDVESNASSWIKDTGCTGTRQAKVPNPIRGGTGGLRRFQARWLRFSLPFSGSTRLSSCLTKCCNAWPVGFVLGLLLRLVDHVILAGETARTRASMSACIILTFGSFRYLCTTPPSTAAGESITTVSIDSLIDLCAITRPRRRPLWPAQPSESVL